NKKELEKLSDNALMMLQVQIEISLLQSTQPNIEATF
ncbi:MAG: hypothetical protein K0R24_2370, partial [Gammaproteobacteria bacterium]|nr:hypothetical protein [Gammaproteobacteria bacterium]